MSCAEFFHENLWKYDFMAPNNKTHTSIQDLWNETELRTYQQYTQTHPYWVPAITDL